MRASESAGVVGEGRTQASGGKHGPSKQGGGPGQSGAGDHPSRPDQDHDPNAATLAQAQTGGGARHRALEIGQPHAALLAAGGNGRCVARLVLCRGLQPALVNAGDGASGPQGPFIVPALA